MKIPLGSTVPRRPVWVSTNDIAYRRRIFACFSGLLTYGSPLEKFAALWPALVPISREPGFTRNPLWINVFDPIDPISGRLLAFANQPVACCPHAQDFGYSSSWWLLLAHIKYLKQAGVSPDTASAAVHWLLTDNSGQFQAKNTGWRVGRWFVVGSLQHRVRTALAWISWILAAISLALLAGVMLPLLLSAAGSVVTAVADGFAQFFKTLPG